MERTARETVTNEALISAARETAMELLSELRGPSMTHDLDDSARALSAVTELLRLLTRP